MVKKDEKFDSEIVGAAAALDLEEIAALGADLASCTGLIGEKGGTLTAFEAGLTEPPFGKVSLGTFEVTVLAGFLATEVGTFAAEEAF
jgi:hypothetical protein